MRGELAALAVADGLTERVERARARHARVGEERARLRGLGARRLPRARAPRVASRATAARRRARRPDSPTRRDAADARSARGSQRQARRLRLERSGRGMYARGAMSLLGLVALVLLCWPGEAHAWGPVTHLVHGSQILENLSSLAPALQEILRRHRSPYLYGCIAADIMHAKKLHPQPLHALPLLARRLADRRLRHAREREEAFAWGYLSHLAADVYSHNHYVPVQLVVSFESRALRHIYWEARFDAAQTPRPLAPHSHGPRPPLRRLRSAGRARRRADAVLVPDQQAHLPLGDGVAAGRAVAAHGARPRRALALPASSGRGRHASTVSARRASAICWCSGRRSACQAADPTGREALARADGAAPQAAQPQAARPDARRRRRRAGRAAPVGRLTRSAHATQRGPRRAAAGGAARPSRGYARRPRPSGAPGATPSGPSASRSWTMLVSEPKPAPGAVTSLATIRSRRFSRSLRRASSVTVRPSRPRSRPRAGGPCCAARPARMSGVRSSSSASGPRALLQLARGRRARPVVGDRGRHHEHRGGAKLRARAHAASRRAVVDRARCERPAAAAGSSARVTSTTSAPRRRATRAIA